MTAAMKPLRLLSGGAAQGLVEALLLSDRLPMAAHVLPDLSRRFRGEFDQLARLEEWAVAEEDEP